MCSACAEESVRGQVAEQLAAPAWPPPLAAGTCAHAPHEYKKGDEVMYVTRERSLVPATVVQVDRSMQPPQYGIMVEDAQQGGDVRYTEFDRLRPHGYSDAPNAGIPKGPSCTHAPVPRMCMAAACA